MKKILPIRQILPKAKQLSNNIKYIDQAKIDEVIKEARQFPKYRLPILLNNSFSEVPQRFVNCLTKFTYVRPHNHIFTGNWELMSWIAGIVHVIFFDEKGKIINKMKMSQDGLKVLEIPPEIYHTFITNDFGVYLEIRNCSYEPDFDRTYAIWSPNEKHAESSLYLERLRHAKENDTVTIQTYDSKGEQQLSTDNL